MSEARAEIGVPADQVSALQLPGLVRALAARFAASKALMLAALMLLGLGPRVWDLGRRSLVLDELSTLAFAAADLGTLRQALAVDANMTMY